jgi:hypothetical protein
MCVRAHRHRLSIIASAVYCERRATICGRAARVPAPRTCVQKAAGGSRGT